MELTKVNIHQEIAQIKEPWVLKKIAQVNDHVVNIIKMKGEFEMHAHEDGEKLFYVAEGVLFIEFADGDVQEIKKGEFVIVPKGVPQKPYAEVDTTLLFFELKY